MCQSWILQQRIAPESNHDIIIFAYTTAPGYITAGLRANRDTWDVYLLKCFLFVCFQQGILLARTTVRHTRRSIGTTSRQLGRPLFSGCFHDCLSVAPVPNSAGPRFARKGKQEVESRFRSYINGARSHAPAPNRTAHPCSGIVKTSQATLCLRTTTRLSPCGLWQWSCPTPRRKVSLESTQCIVGLAMCRPSPYIMNVGRSCTPTKMEISPLFCLCPDCGRSGFTRWLSSSVQDEWARGVLDNVGGHVSSVVYRLRLVSRVFTHGMRLPKHPHL